MSAVQAVNLLSPARRLARVRRRRISRWSAGLTLYVALLAGVWIAVHVGGSGADRTVAAELEAVRGEMEEARATIQALRPELVEARNVLAASRAVGNQPDWSLLLSVLAGLLDEQTVLSDFQIEPATGEPWRAGRARRADAKDTAHGPYRLQLDGFGQSQRAVQRYVLRLEQTGLFEQVMLVDTRTASFGDDEAIAFRVTCQLGEPADSERADEHTTSDDSPTAPARGDAAPDSDTDAPPFVLPDQEPAP